MIRGKVWHCLVTPVARHATAAVKQNFRQAESNRQQIWHVIVSAIRGGVTMGDPLVDALTGGKVKRKP